MIIVKVGGIPVSPQIIFLNPFAGVSYESNSPLLQVFLAAEEVDDDAFERQKHGVDGQIAPVGIQAPIPGKLRIERKFRKLDCT